MCYIVLFFWGKYYFSYCSWTNSRDKRGDLAWVPEKIRDVMVIPCIALLNSEMVLHNLVFPTLDVLHQTMVGRKLSKVAIWAFCPIWLLSSLEQTVITAITVSSTSGERPLDCLNFRQRNCTAIEFGGMSLYLAQAPPPLLAGGGRGRKGRGRRRERRERGGCLQCLSVLSRNQPAGSLCEPLSISVAMVCYFYLYDY